MIGLPFINQLFINILSRSRGIGGRFIYCPKMGAEVNAGDFDQAIQDTFFRDSQAKKYPAAFMTPPISEGKFTDPKGEWENYFLTMFFLSTTYTDSHGITRDRNESTGTSQHTALMDQHDMGRCARNFIYVLNSMPRRRENLELLKRFKPQSARENRILPIAFIAAPNLSGVRLEFVASVFNGCELEDYDPSDIGNIPIPGEDPHPEHNL